MPTSDAYKPLMIDETPWCIPRLCPAGQGSEKMSFEELSSFFRQLIKYIMISLTRVRPVSWKTMVRLLAPNSVSAVKTSAEPSSVAVHWDKGKTAV
jgi:hypothetical protein